MQIFFPNKLEYSRVLHGGVTYIKNRIKSVKNIDNIEKRGHTMNILYIHRC